jgi:hypothetical protein
MGLFYRVSGEIQNPKIAVHLILQKTKRDLCTLVLGIKIMNPSLELFDLLAIFL